MRRRSDVVCGVSLCCTVFLSRAPRGVPWRNVSLVAEACAVPGGRDWGTGKLWPYKGEGRLSKLRAEPEDVNCRGHSTCARASEQRTRYEESAANWFVALAPLGSDASTQVRIAVATLTHSVANLALRSLRRVMIPRVTACVRTTLRRNLDTSTAGSSSLSFS
eukprot:6796409-Prymnesium_polylepis.3